jgi:23S rRNA (cytosine1962-C5)-methyltransferase
MQLRFQENDDFIVYDKAYGHRTHRVSDGQFGLIEFLSEKMDRPLYVVHRLDKETSGLILFAKSKTAATIFGEIFEKHQIQKTYYFLTDHVKTETSFTVKTHIEKKQNFLMNVPGLPPNSETQFEFVKNLGPYFLWRALPRTGKPHQIRLHAEFAKINILGDGEHKGSPYFRLALHAQKLQFNYGGQDFTFESELPPILKENDLVGFDALLDVTNFIILIPENLTA